MQPSTQVTHIPDVVIDSSVLFLVNVAAEAFILDTNIFVLPSVIIHFFISHATQGSM